MSAYGPGGPAPQVTPSGQSALDRGYGTRTPGAIRQALPAAVPVTAYPNPGALPAQVGPANVTPPGPLGPLHTPNIWPG